MDALRTRADLENYAISVSLPLLNDLPLEWDRKHQGSVDHVSYLVSYIEAFCRTLWGLTPILMHRKEPVYVGEGEERLEVGAWFIDRLLKGLDPHSPGYWEKYRSCYDQANYANQMTTELAAVGLAMVLNREKLWDPIPPADQERIAAWLNELSVVAYRNSWPNNHYWFPIMILLSLKRLGMPYDESCIEEGLVKLDQFYVGNGWYRDADFGRFDYYIPWSHHMYPLLWMILEEEDAPGYKTRKEQYLERTNRFLQYFPYWFDSTGLHVPFGRSLSYRYAASALFPMAAYHGCGIDPGLARSVTLANIDYFRRNGAEDGKKIVPGFAYPTPLPVENYMSEGAPYWCVKTFLALLMTEEHPFWTAPDRPHPVTERDYIEKVPVEGVSMVFQGDDKHAGVTLYNNSAHYVQNVFYHKFNDMSSLYSKFAYNTRAGIGMSTRDNVSLDSMIGLETRDAVMCSHRAAIRDLGMDGPVMKSEHTPFSNDPETVITTLMLPLPGGFHIRAHEVRLSRDYRVTEGGFTVGRRNDDERTERGADWIEYRTREGYTWLRSYTPLGLTLNMRNVHPEMHLLHPMAKYPCYSTESILEAGRYVFVTAFFLSDKPDLCRGVEVAAASPEIVLSGDRMELTVRSGGQEYRLFF